MLHMQQQVTILHTEFTDNASLHGEICIIQRDMEEFVITYKPWMAWQLLVTLFYLLYIYIYIYVPIFLQFKRK
jgi:hypothetical protein